MKVTYGLRNRDYLNGYGRITIDPLNKDILQEFNSDTDPQVGILSVLLFIHSIPEVILE